VNWLTLGRLVACVAESAGVVWLRSPGRPPSGVIVPAETARRRPRPPDPPAPSAWPSRSPGPGRQLLARGRVGLRKQVFSCAWKLSPLYQEGDRGCVLKLQHYTTEKAGLRLFPPARLS